MDGFGLAVPQRLDLRKRSEERLNGWFVRNKQAINAKGGVTR